MASGLESLAWRGATAVVVLFASGVRLLMAYVAVKIRRMAGDAS